MLAVAGFSVGGISAADGAVEVSVKGILVRHDARIAEIQTTTGRIKVPVGAIKDLGGVVVGKSKVTARASASELVKLNLPKRRSN